MNLDTWLHFIHVLAAMVWIGGGFMLVLIALRMRSSSNPGSVAEFGRTLPYVGLRVLMPAMVVVLVTGIWMVFENSEWKFSQPWVLLALALFAVAFLIGAVYLSRVGIQLDRTTKGAVEARADITPAVVALISRWLVGYGAVLVVLLVAVLDMVFKPGL